MSSVSLKKLNPQYFIFGEQDKRGRESRTGKVIIFISCTNYFRLMRCFLLIYLNFQISNNTNRMCLPTYFLSSLLPSLRKKVLFNWIRSSQLSSPQGKIFKTYSQKKSRDKILYRTDLFLPCELPNFLRKSHTLCSTFYNLKTFHTDCTLHRKIWHSPGNKGLGHKADTTWQITKSFITVMAANLLNFIFTPPIQTLQKPFLAFWRIWMWKVSWETLSWKVIRFLVLVRGSEGGSDLPQSSEKWQQAIIFIGANMCQV